MSACNGLADACDRLSRLAYLVEGEVPKLHVVTIKFELVVDRLLQFLDVGTGINLNNDERRMFLRRKITRKLHS